MNIRMAGLDWHVPIQLREQLSFPRGRVVELNRLIRDNPGVEGCALLSTCNRTELYLSCAEGTEPDPAGLLCAAAGVDCATPDLRRAGIFLGWCYNAYYAQYLMAGAVERARARGMKVIIVDPRITPAVEKQCDLHLRIKPGTDCALALGLARELIIT